MTQILARAQLRRGLAGIAALAVLASGCAKSSAPSAASARPPPEEAELQPAAGQTAPVACPDKPCGKGQICLMLSGAGRAAPRTCVADPCAGRPLSCDCARTLCPEGRFCQTTAGALTCSARCADPDTPIATPQGERAIARLNAGDLVYSLNRGVLAVVPIARTVRVPARGHRIVEVLLNNGRLLRMSPGHPLPDGRTFSDLAQGDALGPERVLTSVELPYQHEYTYDILPASDSGAYYAAGVLVGSTLLSSRD